MATETSADWKLPWTGGCRCGQVRLKVSEPPIIALACHCAGCQKMSSSAYALTLMLPGLGFAITAGDPVVGGEQKAVGASHYFCPFCKTWMFTRGALLGPFVNLRPTMLDDHRWFAPFVECFVTAKLPWASTAAKYSFDEFPGEADRGKLMAEYAAEGVRPGA